MGKSLGSVGNKFLLLFNIWMVFVVLSILALRFPHWQLTILAIINNELFILLFILSFTLFVRSEYNRFIFLNLTIFSILYIFGFFIVFTGSEYTIGNDHFQYYLWMYRKIAISLMTSIMVTFIIFEYIYFKMKVLYKYALALLITVPVWLAFFHNFLFNKKFIFESYENYLSIYLAICSVNAIIIFYILIYAYHCINKENPISKYINPLMLNLFVFVAIDTVDHYFFYRDIELSWEHQFFLMMSLISINGILGANIYYVYSEFGKFYENFLFSKIKLNMKLKKKKSVTEKYINLVNSYFKDKLNRILFVILMAVSLAFFILIYPFGYQKITFLLLVVLITGIGLYLNALFRRRAKD